MTPQDKTEENLARFRRAEREIIEDLLRALLECEHSGKPAIETRLSGLMNKPLEEVLPALARAKGSDLVDNEANGWRLTGSGRAIAVRIMRAHRLVETRLARESSVPAADWHGVAHAAEHTLSREEVNRLADLLDNPRFDPHGDPIPTREGKLPEPEGEPLLSWIRNEPAVISHIEDEPPSLFARVAEAGIHAGMRLVLKDTTASGCSLKIEARELLLPLELATLVRVRPLDSSEQDVPRNACRLSDIQPGATASVVRLLPGCIGPERSRLLDMGLVPGSRLENALQSPFNGPAAFRVRGTLVALRHSQAEQVLVIPDDPKTISQ
jgi:DtxR family Mn-dependent transcriptional regulator